MTTTFAMTGITSGAGIRFAEIALAQGYAVRGMARNLERSDSRRLASLGATLVRGDLDDEGALEETARGATAFVHCAAHVGDRGEPAEFVRVNVGGTRRALEAARRAGVKRFVHLSSTAVYGRPDRGRVDETWPTKHCGLPYEDTKTDAERLVMSAGPSLGLEVTAIRPPIIYGPYDRNFMPRAVTALEKRRFLLIDGGHAPLNLAWVDHVAEVLLLAATRAEAVGETFNVMDEVDGRPPRVVDVARTIAEAVGAPAPKLSLPYGVAMALGHAVARAHAFAKREGEPMLSPFVVKILTRDVIYDASKAVRLLGFTPKVHALDGVAREARAFAARRADATRPAP